MRKNIKQFVRIVAKCFPVRGPIYEFGSLQTWGQEGFADLRPIFDGSEYVGADIREGPGVDKILNLHDIDLPANSVGTVLCLETLEHVEYPHRALAEIHRILDPSGMVVISSVMNFPIHDYPFDYWRFTPKAFESLLSPYKHVFTGFAGNASFPHTVVGVGFKGDEPELGKFTEEYKQWQTTQKYDPVQVVKSVAPPVLLPYLAHMYLKVLGYGLSRRLKSRG